MDNSIIYEIWLSQVFMHKYSDYGNLIEKFGNAENVYSKGLDEIDFSCYHPTVKEAFKLKDLSLAESVYDACLKKNIGVLGFSDEKYPKNFKSIDCPPIVLYYEGNIDVLNIPCLTVIGQRHPSEDGKLNAAYFSGECEKAGITIVTGFADGVENEVLKHTKKPVTILPSGILKASPRANVKHLKRILNDGGLVISEYAPHYETQPYHFRYRNRLLAAASDATLVIEAGNISGTSITVNFCSLYGKECYVLPGSIRSSHYDGNFKYFKNGASIVTHPAEIIYDYYLRYPYLAQEEPKEEKIDFSSLDETELKIANLLKEEPMSVDEIVLKTNLSANTVNTHIIGLEMIGIIKKNSLDRYEINGR